MMSDDIYPIGAKVRVDLGLEEGPMDLRYYGYNWRRGLHMVAKSKGSAAKWLVKPEQIERIS